MIYAQRVEGDKDDALGHGEARDVVEFAVTSSLNLALTLHAPAVADGREGKPDAQDDGEDIKHGVAREWAPVQEQTCVAGQRAQVAMSSFRGRRCHQRNAPTRELCAQLSKARLWAGRRTGGQLA